MLSLQRKGRGCQESFLSLLVPCLCLRVCVNSSHFRGKANSQQSHGGRASLLISPFPSPTPCLEFVFITSAKCSFNLFPILSLLFKPFASLSMWKVSGMKEPRTWRKTLWVLHFLHFQIRRMEERREHHSLTGAWESEPELSAGLCVSAQCSVMFL